MNASREQLAPPPVQVGWTSWIVPGRPADPIESVKTHRWLAVAVVVTTVMLGLAAAIQFGQAKYNATASVRVLPTYDTRLATDLEPSMIPNIEYSSFVQQQVFEIANPETLIAALRLLGPKASLWQLRNETQQHAAERLLEFLGVKWIPDTFLITVSLQGTKPQGLDAIVNAVVGAYLLRQERQELSGADTRTNLLEQRRANLQRQAEAERGQLSQLAQELGVSTFTTEASDPYSRKLADANIALEKQQRQLIIEQASLSALQSERRGPIESDVNSLAQKIVLDNRDLVTQKSELGNRREATFLQLQGLAPNHPGRPVLEREIADIDKEIDLIDAKAMEQARSVLIGTRSAEIHEQIAAAQTRVDQDQRARDGIEQEVAVLKMSVASSGAKYNEALAVHEQYENHIKALSDINDRIDLLRLQIQSPGVASLELPAQVPDEPEGGKRKIIFGISIILAGLFGVGIPTIIDLTDSRVKSSRELEAILTMPVLNSNVRTDTRPSRQTLRRIALSILRERREAGTRVFVVTAVGERAGTSSLTLSLSNELTELGASTVAVDANAFIPDSRYQKEVVNVPDSNRQSFNCSRNGHGKKLDIADHDAVAKRNPSSAACAHTIVSASDFLPDRIPICQRQIYQGLRMQCVQEILQLALARHDLVLMDAPPVLNSADTAMLVQHPAGVILVVRAERDRLLHVTAAIQELTKLSPPVVGVILERGWPDELGAPLLDERKHEDLPIIPSQETLVLPLSAGSSPKITQYS
jgi:polysaccharide biosynthesis transport protein